MKRITNIILFLIASQAISQIGTKNFNFSIVIDEQVNYGIISGLNLSLSMNNGGMETIAATYYPGNLSLNFLDYKKILDGDVKTVQISFNYTEYCNDKEFANSYNIDIKKAWLTHDFYILYIYNTNKKKYRKFLEPLDGKNYTFEFDYPGGSTRRVRLKRQKENCN